MEHFEQMKLDALRSIAKKIGLNVEGLKKSDLVEMLIEYHAQPKVEVIENVVEVDKKLSDYDSHPKFAKFK